MWSASAAQRALSPAHAADRMRRIPVLMSLVMMSAISGGQFMSLPHGELEDGWSCRGGFLVHDHDRHSQARFGCGPDRVVPVPDDSVGSDLNGGVSRLSVLQQSALKVQAGLHKVAPPGEQQASVHPHLDLA